MLPMVDLRHSLIINRMLADGKHEHDKYNLSDHPPNRGGIFMLKKHLARARCGLLGLEALAANNF